MLQGELGVVGDGQNGCAVAAPITIKRERYAAPAELEAIIEWIGTAKVEALEARDNVECFKWEVMLLRAELDVDQRRDAGGDVAELENIQKCLAEALQTVNRFSEEKVVPKS